MAYTQIIGLRPISTNPVKGSDIIIIVIIFAPKHVGTHRYRLNEVIPMNTRETYFGAKKKIS